VNEFSFYQCRNFDACLEGGQSCDCIGGEIKLNESNQTEAAYILHTSLCGEGYKSDSSLCSHCDTPEYAKTQGRCERCIFNHFTYLILSALLVPTILYVIDLACNSFESIEIVLAFLQFLGVFSGFGVAWPAEIQLFLEFFNVFNVDVDMLHLACAGLSYPQMWSTIAMYVPLVYVLFVMAMVSFNYVVSKLTRLHSMHGLTMRLLGTGWRPKFSLKPVPLLFHWLPLGVRFLNIYYLNGMQRVLMLFKCVPGSYAGEDSYVLGDMPSIQCWADDATFTDLLLRAIVPTFIFILGVPIIYLYILFYLVRQRGLHDPAINEVFGFLWNRFEDRCYWWEIAEILGRKLPLVLIVTFIDDPNDKCFCSALALCVLMAANFEIAPYIKDRYDRLDQISTSAQVALMLLGLRQGSTNMDSQFVNAFVYILCSFVFICSMVSLFYDTREMQLQFESGQGGSGLAYSAYRCLSRLGKGGGSGRRSPSGGARYALSSRVFNVYGKHAKLLHEVGSSLGGEGQARVVDLTETLLKVKLAPSAEDDRASAYLRLANSAPNLLSWLLSEPGGLAERKAAVASAAALVRRAMVATKADRPPAVRELLHEQVLKRLLPWLCEESAPEVERASTELVAFISRVREHVEAKRRVSPEKASRRIRFLKAKLSAAITERQSPEAVLLPLLHKLLTRSYFELAVVSPLSGEVSATLRGTKHQDAAFDAKACRLPAVSVVMRDYDRSAADRARILEAIRGELLSEPPTPAALCVIEGGAVIVQKSFKDKRFGTTQRKLDCLAISQLHVPLMLPRGTDGEMGGAIIGVLSLISRIDPSTNLAGVEIDEARDVEMATAFGEMVVEAVLSCAHRSANKEHRQRSNQFLGIIKQATQKSLADSGLPVSEGSASTSSTGRAQLSLSGRADAIHLDPKDVEIAPA